MSKRTVYALLLVTLSILFGLSKANAQPRAPLFEFWSSNREDYFTTATPRGVSDADNAQYAFGRNFGWIYSPLGYQPTGTVELVLYYHPSRGDNFTTATAQGRLDAQNAGYVRVRTEGYVYTDPDPTRVPLDLYYHDQREDNYTTASTQGAQDALRAGYRRVRTEGFADSGPPQGALNVWWSPTRQDYFTTGTLAGERDALAVGYRYITGLFSISPVPQPGLIPLKLFWSAQREDNFTTASAQGEQDAINAGYSWTPPKTRAVPRH